MDFLDSLNVEELPEQQTRMLHLLEEHPDFQLQLGFDACCSCGKPVAASPAAVIQCRHCRRVNYCSEACRDEDANASSRTAVVADGGEEEEGETALGHSAIVCSLLNLCNDDDAVDEGEKLDDAVKHAAAVRRVRSEYESYPATLANVLMEGPCFQETLLRKNETNSKFSNGSALVVHVVGASEDAELSQGPTFSKGNHRGVCQDYADACAELADCYNFDRIVLVFIGPECPEQAWNETRTMKNVDKEVGTLSITTIRGIYCSQTLDQVSVGTTADIVVFFNPGFTVPDYEQWKETLQSIPVGTPFLSTTNTEMEGIADSQFLLDQDKIQTLPPGLADILGVYSTGDDESSNSFFAVNPFAGSRVRQSGTMANDLYVKNRWMLGAVIGSFNPSAQNKQTMTSPPSKKAKGASSNSKAGNPALI